MSEPPAVEEPVTCVCGRLLTDDLSRSRKLGPVCWRKLHGRTTSRPRVTSPAAPVSAGQDELPLEPLQPTLWSPG